MRNVLQFAWGVLLGVFAASSNAVAQSPTFSTDVKVVNLLVTAQDRDGAIVKDLTKDDFVVEEDGRPQTIRYFSRESDLPLIVGLLIDTSYSQRNIIPDERRASLAFLSRVLRDGIDRASVISFDEAVHLYQRTTGSRAEIAAALDQLNSPFGHTTVLYDAIAAASEDLMRKEHGRKAFILISDGVDVGGKANISFAIEYAQRADVLIYSIVFGDYLRAYNQGTHDEGFMYRAVGAKTMQRLSQETGGGFFEVSKSKSLEQVYGEIEDELRNQYSIGYTPDVSKDKQKYRHVKVTVKRKGVSARTRDGYYP
jgi:VWFA-related protein